MEIRVFISYKWQDSVRNAWAEKLYRELRMRGIDARLDKYEVAPGESFSAYMTKNIKEVEHIVFIATPEAVKSIETGSGALAFEMQIANARRLAREGEFSIIPIFREGSASSTYLSDHRYLDFRDDENFTERVEELVKWLKGEIKPPPIADSNKDLLKIKHLETRLAAKLEKVSPIVRNDNGHEIHKLRVESLWLMITWGKIGQG